MREVTMPAFMRNNWFWPVAAVLVAAAWALATISAAPMSEGFEWALVFDAVITLPVLYLLCFRARFTTTALVVRVVALQCAGIWLAAKLVPVGDQSILPYLTWVRWAGLAIVTMFEIRLFVAVVKLQSRPTTRQDELEAAGMPPLLAKLAMLEARFWRWILRRPKQ